MLDFSQVDNFARRLYSAEVDEKAWSEKWAGEVAEEMSPPVRTGRLRRSIHQVGSSVMAEDYWEYVERGTIHQAPQPFVNPAVNGIKPRAAEDAGDRAIRAI